MDFECFEREESKWYMCERVCVGGKDALVVNGRKNRSAISGVGEQEEVD